MKNIIIPLLCLVHLSTQAQRYLTPIFSEVDSIIGSIYGKAENYLGINQNLLFDFYTPKMDNSTKRPLIIYIHGGGFTSGTRSYPSIKLLCQKMAKKGYAVASIDYRLDTHFELYNSESDRHAMTDAMHDAKQAIRYFKANAALYKIDTSKVFIGGESAGAITAMMAAFVDKQKEMIPYPKANPDDPVGSDSNRHEGNGVQGVLCLCGAILDTTAIELPDEPPILWTHGSADAVIPISFSFNIILRAAHIGLPFQSHVYNGATHCPWYFGLPNWQIYLDSTINDITTFLYPKVSQTSGLNDIQLNNISIFPNPCQQNLKIDLSRPCSKANIALKTFDGQVFRMWRFQNLQEIDLNLIGLANGLYFLHFEIDDKSFVKKILIYNP